MNKPERKDFDDYEDYLQAMEAYADGLERDVDSRGTLYDVLTIMVQYGKEYGNVHGEHDIIYLNSPDGEMKEDDILKLFKLGVHLEYGSFAMFQSL